MKLFKSSLNLVVAVLLLSACSNNSSEQQEASMSSETGENTNSNSPNSSLIQLTVPDSNRGKIVLDVQNRNNLKSITLVIDQMDNGKINRLPYEYYYDGTVNQKEEIIITARAVNLDDSVEISTKVIKNVGSDLPGSDPTTDPSCFANPNYDSCLFYKNPVAQNKAALSSKVAYGADLSAVQVFGVKLRNLTNPSRLTNTSIDVSSSAGQRAAPINGKWNFEYKTDTNHKVSQVMAFYWLNEQIEYMKTNSGAFYAENKNIKVDAFSSAVRNNAYWDGANIVMGNFGTQELALSSEVYLHEMGHANLDFATNGRINISSNFCPTKFGCIGAIHEGMADAHAFIMFPNDPAMAQSVTNTLNGWTNRDPRNFVNQNVDYFFNTVSGGGEIHGMGTAYSTILWQILKDPAMNPKHFETMFSMHLPRLTSSSDFRTAKTIWMNLSDTQYSGQYTSLIRGYFEKMGVN